MLQAANNILQQTFGMELVELQPMPTEKDMSEKDAELLNKTGVKKKSTPYPSLGKPSHNLELTHSQAHPREPSPTYSAPSSTRP